MSQTPSIGDWKIEQARLALEWKLAEYQSRFGLELSSPNLTLRPLFMLPIDQHSTQNSIRPVGR
jgi:hypothetical protein